MEAEPVGPVFLINARVAGADEASLAVEKNIAAIGQHVPPGAVHKGAGDFFTATDTDFISAVGATTAGVPIYEEIIILAVPGEAGGFDGGVIAFMMPGQTIDRGIRGDSQSGGGVQLDQFDAAPIGTESEPQTAIVIPENAGVNGVEVIIQRGADDGAGIGPMKVGGGGIEGGVGDQPDGGDAFTPGGGGVIQQIAVALLDDVRGPKHALVAGHGIGDPGGHLAEYARPGEPVREGGGMMRRDAHAGGEEPMFMATAGDGGGIVDVHAAWTE